MLVKAMNYSHKLLPILMTMLHNSGCQLGLGKYLAHNYNQGFCSFCIVWGKSSDHSIIKLILKAYSGKDCKSTITGDLM